VNACFARRARALKALIVVVSLLAASLVGVAVTAAPAFAVGSYNNADIATDALGHLNQNLGSVSGQCKQFANDMVKAASGNTQSPSGYQSGWAALGNEVSSAGAVKGDIIQITPAGSTDSTAESLYNYSDPSMRLHTAIIVANNGGGSFDVVDANFTATYTVGQHTFNPYTWAYNTTTHTSSIVKIWRLGTPSVGGGGGGSDYGVAFNSGNLWLYGPGLGTIDTGLGMMPGTNPSITKLASGGYEVAFVANTGHLWVYGAAVTSDTGLGVASGTSPAITAVGSGFEVAFNSGNLWVYGTVVTANTGFGMQAGTSPAITAVGSSNYQVAFNSGNMWLYGAITSNTGFGMASGTSPAATTTSGGGTEETFNSGTAWVYGAIVTGNTGYGVATGTSPAITTESGTYELAFNSAATGNLMLYGSPLIADTGYGMMAGTSPAITAVSGGTEEAFVGNTGELWVYGSVVTSNTHLGVASGTSPAIAS
jgi:hypothetical protein